MKIFLLHGGISRERGMHHRISEQKLRNICLLFERYGHAESAQAEDQAVLEFVNAWTSG